MKLLLLLLLFAPPSRAVNKTISVPCAANGTAVTVSLPQGRVGASYKVTFVATSGVPPFRFLWISGSLPAGLDWYDGVISGVPQSKITTQFTIECRDSTVP